MLQPWGKNIRNLMKSLQSRKTHLNQVDLEKLWLTCDVSLSLCTPFTDTDWLSVVWSRLVLCLSVSENMWNLQQQQKKSTMSVDFIHQHPFGSPGCRIMYVTFCFRLYQFFCWGWCRGSPCSLFFLLPPLDLLFLKLKNGNSVILCKQKT